MRRISILFLLIVFCTACPEPPEPVTGQLVKSQFERLRHTSWVPGTITLNTQDLMSVHPSLQNFELTFNGTLSHDGTNVNGSFYTNDEQTGIMPGGSWTFKEKEEFYMMYMNEIEVFYTVSEDSLGLYFTNIPPENGRTQSTTSDYVFKLVPKK